MGGVLEALHWDVQEFNYETLAAHGCSGWISLIHGLQFGVGGGNSSFLP